MKTPFRGFSAILLKEFLVALRDPLTLFFMFFPALIQMVAFGYALDTDVKHIPTALLNEDRTVESRRIVDEFVNTGTFRVIGEVASVSELARMIRTGKAFAGLQIPPDFTRDLRAGRPAQVQLLIDGSNSSVAGSALNTAVAVALRESVVRMMGELGRRDIPVEVRPQMLYNPAMLSANFFLPGVIGLVTQIAMVFATAMSIVRERERGTLDQLLVSPMSRWGLMLGKLTPYLCIGGVMVASLVAVMRWLFQVPIHGSLLALAVAMLAYLFTLLSLGLLISTQAQNQMQAIQMTVGLILPTVFFSGFIFPRETMPKIFQLFGALLPATYYIELQRAIVLRGASLADFWSHLVVLTIMGVAVFSLCALRLKHRVS